MSAARHHPTPAEALLPPGPGAGERLAGLATRPYRRGAETLGLALAPEADGVVAVAAYDFREYRARYTGVDPDAPRYVLTVRHAAGPEDLRLAVDFAIGEGPETSAEIKVPAASPAGRSFVLPISGDPQLRVARLRLLGAWPEAPEPVGSETGGDGRFRLVALLGNVAKMLYVLGAEKDEIKERLAEVARQRSLAHAGGQSLDLHGRDLGVPRFPPRPYTFDESTLALYHFDAPFEAGGELEEETARFGRPGHPATDAGAVSVAGIFGSGVTLTNGGHLRIPHHADFNLAAEEDFTVELFVRLGSAADESGVRTLIAKAALDENGTPTGDGWSLVVGDFRGLEGQPRFSLRAGTETVEVFADLSLSPERFHHLAAAVDRTGGLCRLFVDGAEAARANLGELGAVSNGRLLRIGQAGGGQHPLNGVIDELRFSSNARSAFHPALGEGDASYRQRLGLFARWLLPTAENLRRRINTSISIDGDPESFVVEERDRPLRAATLPLRVVPRRIVRRQHLDHDGDPRRSIDEAAGTVRDEPPFSPLFLQERGGPRLSVMGGGPARLQKVTARALDELLDLLDELGEPGPVEVLKAYDPAVDSDHSLASGHLELHRVGRALLLRHPMLESDVFAARCHRAGFHWTYNRGDAVAVASAPGPLLDVVAEVEGTFLEPESAVDESAAVDLRILPASLPTAARFEWTVIPCGGGGATMTLHPAEPGGGLPATRRPRVRLESLVPGTVTIAVEVRHQGVTARGSRQLVIDPAEPLSEEPEEARLEIVREGGGAPPAVVEVGDAVELELRPEELLEDVRFSWSVDPVGFGRGELLPVFEPRSTFIATRAGLLVVTALAIDEPEEENAGPTPPYTFSVRLNDELEAAGSLIPKNDYDRLMNLLNHFHPIGVEVRTERVRERVVEVREDLLQAFAGYTYPEFRLPGFGSSDEP